MTTDLSRLDVPLSQLESDMHALVERQRKAAAEQAAVDSWNAAYKVGTPVVAYPGFRPELDRNATRIVTATRSKATVLSGHTAVVWVHGHSACIALSHIDVRTQATPGECAEMRHLLLIADEDATVPAFVDLRKGRKP